MFVAMVRHVDRDRIRHAQLSGAVIGIRDQLRLDTDNRAERLRADWPELWDRIQEAVDLIDW